MLTPQEFTQLALIFMGCSYDAFEVQSPTQGPNFANAPCLLEGNPK